MIDQKELTEISDQVKKTEAQVKIQSELIDFENLDLERLDLIQYKGVQYWKFDTGSQSFYFDLNGILQEDPIIPMENLNVNPKEIFGVAHKDIEIIEKLKAFFKKYVYLEDDEEYDLLSLYVVLTFVFHNFQRIPYLHLNGLQDTGKTNLLKIFDLLCRKSRKFSNVSPASVFRVISTEKPTLLLDESEKIGKRNGNFNIIVEILNSGYEKDGKVVRMSGNEAKEFKTYCPKIIASINDLHPTISDRCIVINTKPAPVSFFKNSLPDDSELNMEAQELKTELLKSLKSIASDLFSNMQYDFQITLANRDRDRWLPILILSKTFSNDNHDYVQRISKRILKDLEIKKEEKSNLPENLAREIVSEFVAYASKQAFAVDTTNYYFRADLIQNLVIKNDEHNFYSYKGEITSVLKKIGIKTTRRRRKGSAPISLYVIPKNLIIKKDGKDV